MKNLLSILFSLFIFSFFAQQGDGGQPFGYFSHLKANLEIPYLTFQQPNVDSLRAEDAANEGLEKGPWRFGYNHSTDIDFINTAVWYAHPSGGKVGILKIAARYAKTINLTFANTEIPEGNSLFVYNEDQSFILGEFTQNHIYKGYLGTELVPGNTVYVEYYVADQNEVGSVEISTVTHGYRTAREYQTKAFGNSANCNMNVNCPDGLPFASQRNSAVMLVVGSNGFCSGALINNTKYNGKPYVLTANHCKAVNDDFPNWVFRFNWQSPNCDNPNSAPTDFQSLSGAVLRARRVPSDFMLVEIMGGLDTGIVPESHSPYYAGWDRGNAAPSSTYSIHHPTGDIKKISFDDDPAVAVQAMQSTEANSSWKVIWDRNTTTEWASSGAPLFNQDGLIIGQLWGGNASCDPTSPKEDYFGRIHNSWEPTGSTYTDQLKHWLAPIDDTLTSIFGYDPYRTQLEYNLSLEGILGPADNLCSNTFKPQIKILNNGDSTVTNFEIEFSYNNGTQEVIQWTGNLPLYTSTTIELGEITQLEGNNLIHVKLKNPNGNLDQDTSDNEINYEYHASPNGTPLNFNFYMGCYADEVSWKLIDEEENVLYSGDNYAPANAPNLYEEAFCLSDACYELILMDSYGDGVEGAAYNQCGYTGSMTLTNAKNNEIVAELKEEDANFGTKITFKFCFKDEKLGDEDLLIYPNPSDGNFKILTQLKGKKSIEIYALTGQKVLSLDTESKQIEIDEKQLAEGMYLVHIYTADRKITRKIVVSL